MIARGQFVPKNIHKYKGDASKIVYRSSWERRVMVWLDNHPSIIWWNSEETVVGYRSPIDGKIHRYYPDFLIQVKTKDGKVKTEMWEIKPEAQVGEPERKSRTTRRYIAEVVRYGINDAKWKAATEYCLDRGWAFRVLTEKDLGLTP